MELRCLGQTLGSRGREPWVNFTKPPPPPHPTPSRREREALSPPEFRFFPLLSLYDILAVVCETRGRDSFCNPALILTRKSFKLLHLPFFFRQSAFFQLTRRLLIGPRQQFEGRWSL